jgi:predicted nucleotide-binding protein (sugar kinase/HSP70/actin superfamily)
MSLRIGIPRALLYYRYFPFWETFFQTLGFEVVVSRPSHRGLIEEGFKFADDDTCIPMKMAFAHTINIKDQIDFLFLPRLLSLDGKTCACPRLTGLPEMLKYSIPGLPTILDPYVDERHRNSTLFRSFSEMALALGKRSKKIQQAFQEGEMAYRLNRKRMEKGEKIPELFEKAIEKNPLNQKGHLGKKITVVGHPYCLYDPYFNFDLLKIFHESQVSVYTQEMISREVIDSEIREFGKNVYWDSGREILGASLHHLHSNQVDGLIYLTCFSCGVDSMIEPLVKHRMEENEKILYLCLMIDEHTGSTGLLTRVEAFLETLERKKSGRRMA